MRKYNKIMGRLLEHKIEVETKLKELGFMQGEDYIFESISLQGSQNYNTDTENSDVDSKYCLVPTVRSLLRGVDFTRDITISKNEKVSVKSFPDFVNLFFKGNVNNLEMLFTDYMDCNYNLGLMYNTRKYREDIVKASINTVTSACIGMMLQKQNTMFKGTETTLPFVDKLGFDPKDCQHIYRLSLMTSNLLSGSSFESSLSMGEDFLVVRDAMYSGTYSKEDMSRMVDCWIAGVKTLEKAVNPQNNTEKIKELKESIVQSYEDNYDEYLREDIYSCKYCS